MGRLGKENPTTDAQSTVSSKAVAPSDQNPRNPTHSSCSRLGLWLDTLSPLCFPSSSRRIGIARRHDSCGTQTAAGLGAIVISILETWCRFGNDPARINTVELTNAGGINEELQREVVEWRNWCLIFFFFSSVAASILHLSLFLKRILYRSILSPYCLNRIDPVLSLSRPPTAGGLSLSLGPL